MYGILHVFANKNRQKIFCKIEEFPQSYGRIMKRCKLPSGYVFDCLMLLVENNLVVGYDEFSYGKCYGKGRFRSFYKLSGLGTYVKKRFDFFKENAERCLTLLGFDVNRGYVHEKALITRIEIFKTLYQNNSLMKITEILNANLNISISPLALIHHLKKMDKIVEHNRRRWIIDRENPDVNYLAEFLVLLDKIDYEVVPYYIFEILSPLVLDTIYVDF